jgi:signal transduction histidine kinase
MSKARRQWSVGFRYGLALLILVAAHAIQELVYEFIYPTVYDFSILAVILIAWLCGRWPALLAIAIATFSANYMFVEPRWTWVTFTQTRYIAFMALFVAAASLAAIGVAATSDALQRAERELVRRKQVEKEREILLAVITHDLRSPLSSVRMVAELLREREKGCIGAQQAAGRILRITGRLARLVEQLLEYSQCETTGTLPIDRAPADMRDVWREVIQDIELESDHVHRIDFSFEGNSKGNWDRDRLEQVAQNLLINALDHGEPETPVHVVGRGQNGQVTVEVHNHALEPLPKEKLTKLFQPFGSSGRKKVGTRSTGMGLYIARQIALAHGGDIGARFNRDEVVFAVTLPRN